MSLARPAPLSAPALAAAVAWVAKLGLAAVFIVAGVEKLVDPQSFAQQIANYQLLPQLAPYLATVLPGIEVVVGLVLAVMPADSVWLRASALLTAGLMVMFTVAVISVIVRGIDIECGCFSGSSDSITWWTVLRDLALLGLAALVFGLARRRRPA